MSQLRCDVKNEMSGDHVQIFESLGDAISYAFRNQKTSKLTLDKICEVLEDPNLFIKSRKNGMLPCSTIPRRKISSTLSSSEMFIRAGPPRACLWAISLHNPYFLSDSAIMNSVETTLTTGGPLTTDEILNQTNLSGTNKVLLDRFFSDHVDHFSLGTDGRWWFNNQPLPEARQFESINSALLYAFTHIKEASIEELHWFLCLSTIGTTKKPITRRSISRELSRRPNLFLHMSRARYTLTSNHCGAFNSLPVPPIRPPALFIEPPSSSYSGEYPRIPKVEPVFHSPIYDQIEDIFINKGVEWKDDLFDVHGFFDNEDQVFGFS